MNGSLMFVDEDGRGLRMKEIFISICHFNKALHVDMTVYASYLSYGFLVWLIELLFGPQYKYEMFVLSSSACCLWFGTL
jgi:nitrate reductase NapE component